MRLEHALILNRYLHGLFDASDLTGLKSLLAGQTEGPSPLGQSYFYGALLGRVEDAALRDKLAEYDARVMGYEARLAKARGHFAFKYFQYLGLLYTEMSLRIPLLRARCGEGRNSLRLLRSFAAKYFARLAWFALEFFAPQRLCVS
jgi:hypothetical protein